MSGLRCPTGWSCSLCVPGGIVFALGFDPRFEFCDLFPPRFTSCVAVLDHGLGQVVTLGFAPVDVRDGVGDVEAKGISLLGSHVSEDAQGFCFADCWLLRDGHVRLG
jgi:hypothetical protein